ncbi:hypothetical protein KEJ26_04430 [Candidatus Bathyarchaeota archaeon]|nr:hypothetical protein [Candidatus Bathyarchaeota archaeon]
MKIVLSKAAERYVTEHVREGDPAIFICQAGCCTPQPTVVYGSRGSVDPEFLTSYFEERGKTNGVSMFLDKRLSEHLKPFRLVIDVDRQSTSKSLKLKMDFRILYVDQESTAVEATK